MRKKLQELYDHISGRTVYVIGGGPSILDLDTKMLDGKHIIAINNGCELFPQCDAIYWADDSWASNNYKILNAHPCNIRFTHRQSADHYIRKDILANGNACVLKDTGNYGIDSNVDNVRGNNSGAQVINLCTNMKVSRIVLLGFDMRTVNRKSNFHDKHLVSANDKIYESFIKSIESMQDDLIKANIEVINCTPRSGLKCFPIDKLDGWV